MPLRRHLLAPVLLLSVLSACGSSSDDPTSVGGDAAGAGAGAGAGGSSSVGGGSGHGGASAGAAGAAGQAGAAPAGAGGTGGSAGGGGGSAGTGGAAGGSAGTAGNAGTTAAGGTSAGGASGSAGNSPGGAGAGGGGAGGSMGGSGGAGANAGAAGTGGAGAGGAPSCGDAASCEDAAATHFDALVGNAPNAPDELAAFLTAIPKGGDLHNHLTGAVYAETYLAWGKSDGDCVNASTFSVVFGSQCSATNVAIPTSGMLFDEIVDAWSMKDFVPGTQSGHDHFFATFGKYGTVAGAHRDDDIADVLTRAASENQLYVETMFNLGKNIGALSAKHWSGTLTAADLPGLYASIIADTTFATELSQDVAVVDSASTAYRATLGCTGANPPAACDVGVRFIAQVARTGATDTIFGQLISAFEMAAKTPGIVGANLSSPEDDTTSLKNYELHMAMLDFLHQTYIDTGKSPLHITLHAGELTPKYLPAGYATANTFHIRDAVEKGHAERIGHGLDVMSETDPQGLLAEMSQNGVLVEVCLSSNTQILEVSGAAHPLGQYIASHVPVSLGTDDQGVSRSSMAGEYTRAALDQKLAYGQLKTMARDSLEHSFLPGASLWTSLPTGQPVPACAEVTTMSPTDVPTAACQAYLDVSERAKIEWQLEHRYRVFESQP